MAAGADGHASAHPHGHADGLRTDPESYQGLDEHQRAAAVWMVRAGWLTPDIGWTYLREVGAGDVTTDEGDEADFIAPRPGASTELQIAEAIELALDVRRHHDSTVALDQAVGFIRRCLVALGHTGLGAIRVTRHEDHAAIEADDLGCLVLPGSVGPFRDADRDRAKQLPEPARFVTNGVRIERLTPGKAVILEIRSPTEARQLDRLLRGQSFGQTVRLPSGSAPGHPPTAQQESGRRTAAGRPCLGRHRCVAGAPRTTHHEAQSV